MRGGVNLRSPQGVNFPRSLTLATPALPWGVLASAWDDRSEGRMRDYLAFKVRQCFGSEMIRPSVR
jgi:hypothetical protein